MVVAIMAEAVMQVVVLHKAVVVNHRAEDHKVRRAVLNHKAEDHKEPQLKGGLNHKVGKDRVEIDLRVKDHKV